MIHCHCSMCRKHHGTGFATFVAGPIAGFRWTSGEDRRVRYQSSPSGERTFCGVCGSAGPAMMPEHGIAAAPAASFDGELGIKPQSHFFVGSKAPWYAITDALPRHDAYPPGFSAEVVPRPSVTPRSLNRRTACHRGDRLRDQRRAGAHDELPLQPLPPRRAARTLRMCSTSSTSSAGYAARRS
jgi:hypothetical protein